MHMGQRLEAAVKSELKLREVSAQGIHALVM
jgi:hypothetical protein